MGIVEYIDSFGRSPFAQWFGDLEATAALKVNTYLTRLAHGNTSQVKSVGNGVLECRIDWGPGYRLYFGRDGNALVVLLAGGTKKRQQQDIQIAKERWQDYKKRKKDR